MKTVWLVVLISTLLFLLAALGCREDSSYSPFFNPPEPPEPYYPAVGLELFSEDGEGIKDDCSRLLNRSDSLFLLEVQVGRPKPEMVPGVVRRIELEVSVGLMNSGLVVADTTGYVVNSDGEYLGELPRETPNSSRSGDAFSTAIEDTLAPVIEITGYLGNSGYLVLLELPLEITDTLWNRDIFSIPEGDTLISIIAITRYLDGSGGMLLPMGRTIHECIMKW